MTADLVPVAALSLREVRNWRELPFALLPAVWAHQDREPSAGIAHLAVLAYLLIALPLLPTLIPLAVLLLEPHGARLRVAPFVLLGAVVSAYLAFVVLAHPVEVTRHRHALDCHTGIQHGGVWAALYVVAVIGPALLSRYPSIIGFGVVNLVGLVVVGVLYTKAFASLWCIYAASGGVGARASAHGAPSTAHGTIALWHASTTTH